VVKAPKLTRMSNVAQMEVEMSSSAWLRVVVAAILVATESNCASIPPGRTGVEWTLSKGTLNKTLDEGFHVVSPFTRVYSVDLREQERAVNLQVLANNGLDIQITSSVLYQPIPDQAADLIREVGPDYYATLIGPYVSSSARRVVGRYSPEEIYSTKREEIESEIRDQVARKLDGKHVRVDSILIREVHLPQEVEQAIQTKLREEQRALEMEFVLQRARQEAERKRIEAKGIADYQATISKELTPQVIEWNGIEATEKLAESPNAKVVVIGSGKEGLPVILNSAESGVSAGNTGPQEKRSSSRSAMVPSGEASR
jgi:regulator of protease activity HflC (stomatin/prohibitin superfamily)